jgi:hypothetical protein
MVLRDARTDPPVAYRMIVGAALWNSIMKQPGSNRYVVAGRAAY